MEVIEYLNEMRDKVKDHTEKLELKEKSTNKNLAKPFKDISNKLYIAIQLTIQILQTPFKSNETSDLKAIHKQILKTIYRDFLFVATISTIEYHFLQILLQYPNYNTTERIQKKGVRNVKISQLIKWANEEKILVNYDLWDFVISARNDIVHYNAIARNKKTCPIRDFPINMIQGNELTGNLRSLLSLTKHIEESFFNIVLGLQE